MIVCENIWGKEVQLNSKFIDFVVDEGHLRCIGIKQRKFYTNESLESLKFKVTNTCNDIIEIKNGFLVKSNVLYIEDDTPHFIHDN